LDNVIAQGRDLAGYIDAQLQDTLVYVDGHSGRTAAILAIILVFWLPKILAEAINIARNTGHAAASLEKILIELNRIEASTKETATEVLALHYRLNEVVNATYPNGLPKPPWRGHAP
jgi:hypothetical protein